jgi:Na+/H+ antiporter NhaD/arsenite permease-like protein
MVTLSIVLFCVIIALSLYDEHVQPGLLAIAAGLFLALAIGGWGYSETIALFPASLFLTLTGILLFFGSAVANGTIDNIVHWMLDKMPATHPALIPFAMAGGVVLLTSLGVGNIGATAILAPAAMSVARKIELKPFLMILLIVGAANAGALSPLAVTGVLTRELISARMHEFGQVNLGEFGARLFTLSFIAQTVISFLGFFLLGGSKWIREVKPSVLDQEGVIWDRDQRITLGSIAMFVVTILLFSLPILPAGSQVRAWGSQVAAVAFLTLSILLILRAADIKRTFNAVPWSSIMMISGIVMYIEIASRAGAIDALTTAIVQLAPGVFLLPLLFAFSALLSVFSSSSGVVMPLFVSLAPGLAGAGVSPVDIVTGVGISAHLVDTSPLSSLGALCIAAAQTHGRTPGLYRSLLMWALFMVPTGALISWLLASL